MALSIFGKDIDLENPLIFNKKYIFFQPKSIAMAPNGNMYFNPKGNLYSPDFSKESITMQALFIHEMTHVWQYQHRVNVRTKALVNRSYNYLPMDSSKSFSDYGLEQQGEIVSDYFLMKSGYNFAQPMPSIKIYESLIPFVK